MFAARREAEMSESKTHNWKQFTFQKQAGEKIGIKIGGKYDIRQIDANSPLVRTSDKRAPRVGDRAAVLLALVVSRIDRQEIRSDKASASIQPLLAASTLMAVTTGLTYRVTISTPNQQMA